MSNGREKWQALVSKAVAIKYEPDKDVAPVVVAKGKGFVAERIVKLAREHGVYVHQDVNLVQLLMDIQIDEAIPPQLYQVVAKVLGMVYRVNHKLAGERGLGKD